MKKVTLHGPNGALKPLIDKKAVAQSLGVSVTTVSRLMRAREIGYFRFGGRIRFAVEHVEEFKERNERPRLGRGRTG